MYNPASAFSKDKGLAQFSFEEQCLSQDAPAEAGNASQYAAVKHGEVSQSGSMEKEGGIQAVIVKKGKVSQFVSAKQDVSIQSLTVKHGEVNQSVTVEQGGEYVTVKNDEVSQSASAEQNGTSESVTFKQEVSDFVFLEQGGSYQFVTFKGEEASQSVSAEQVGDCHLVIAEELCIGQSCIANHGDDSQFVTAEEIGVSHDVTAESTGTSAESSSEIPNTSSQSIQSRPTASKMVVDTIKSLRWRKGVTQYAICREIERSYKIEKKKVKPMVSKAIKKELWKGNLRKVPLPLWKKPRYVVKEPQRRKKAILMFPGLN